MKSLASTRRRGRGAIFVEAIIIVSSLTFMFLSLVFFRDMYLKKLRVARLARATVIAYSMQGCPDGQNPAQWASVDLDPSAGRNTPPVSTSPVSTPNNPALPSKRGTEIMKELSESGVSGNVNPIADLGFSMKAGATTKRNLFASRKGYSATMASTSFVSCGEGLKPDGFKGVMKYATSKFNLLKADDPKNGSDIP